MRTFSSALVVVEFLFAVTDGSAQSAAPDLYHVHLTKAAPCQAAALGESLRVPDPKTPMPTHQLVLRHQHGDDWDFAVIQHVGPKTSIEVAAYTPPPPAVDKLRAWHEDTWVAGPSWPEFAKAMGATENGGVYVVSIWRPEPGHREQLQKALGTPPGAKASGTVLLSHLEGGAWTFLSLTRYNTWADFAADQTPAGSTDAAAWSEIRAHGQFHRDTITDRLQLK
jgi:hypothetical protein